MIHCHEVAKRSRQSFQTDRGRLLPPRDLPLRPGPRTPDSTCTWCSAGHKRRKDVLHGQRYRSQTHLGIGRKHSPECGPYIVRSRSHETQVITNMVVVQRKAGTVKHRHRLLRFWHPQFPCGLLHVAPQGFGTVTAQQASPVHQGDAMTALRLIHVWRGHHERQTAPNQIVENLPEFLA